MVGAWLGRAMAWLALVAVAACAGGGDDDRGGALRITDVVVLQDTQSVLLQGDGFLPPGSSCPGRCEWLGPPVFGQLGTYTLRWENTTSATSGEIGLRWICNCGGSAPFWSTLVPLVPGENRIVVTERAGATQQRAEVSVTRR